MRLWSFLLFIIIHPVIKAQHYRGLSVVNDKTAWISGSKGTVVRTVNGGLSWDTIHPAGYEYKDFRDIHAWNSKHAIVMSSGDSGVVLETKDAGKTWKLRYHDYRPGAFLDAMDVRKRKVVIVGDYTDSGKFYLVYGKTPRDLHKIDNQIIFPAYTREDMERDHPISTNYFESIYRWNQSYTFFAASGSNVFWVSKDHFLMIPICHDSAFIVSGGIRQSKTLLAHNIKYIPLIKTKYSGAYSFGISKNSIIAVGGTFEKPILNDSVAAITSNGGKSWQSPKAMPGGYRSAVYNLPNSNTWICTGSSGTDLSLDNGVTWQSTDMTGFNTIGSSKNYLWLVGNKGKWQRVELRLLNIKP